MYQPNPTISIIVPMYNAAMYVAETIQSVLDQTYAHWELILVDDGSTDRTKNIVTPFLDDDRIRYFHKKNGGQGSARNIGIMQAKGSYVAFLDADDLWDQDKLRSQIKIMLKENVSLVFSKIRCINDEGKLLNREIGSGSGIYQGFTALFLLAGGSISIPNSSVIVKKERVQGVGSFNEEDKIRNIEDYHMWFRMLLDGCKVYGMEQVLGSYRVHEKQNTFIDSHQNLKMIAYLDNLRENYPEKKAFFKFLILQRLSTYYNQHQNKYEAKKTCVRIYESNACINSYWFERYLIDVVNLTNYLRFRRLLIRRFRRFKTFVNLIEKERAHQNF